MVAVTPSPAIALLDQAQVWAAERGVSLTVFSDWATLVIQALLWAPTPRLEAAAMLPGRIEQRLTELEASSEAVQLRAGLIRAQDAANPADAA